ncbi:type II toxin-antitoxin system RelB/DinJ family antitoxin [Lonepinella sp. BR2474]|uniref:type II toxin-antitoxin system RelB/DinJ family antitoxin n=1 Tax=Lonepinella sp. BR2474 TaxID=3434548 RepID=UPI003F6DC477
MSNLNVAINFRTTDSLKVNAYKVIKNYGFTPSQVFNLFLTEIANTKTIPLNLSYLKPNAETLGAMEEVNSGNMKYHLVDDNEATKCKQHI